MIWFKIIFLSRQSSQNVCHVGIYVAASLDLFFTSLSAAENGHVAEAILLAVLHVECSSQASFYHTLKIIL